MLDAALIRSGNVSIDGDDRRRVQIARLVGFESSFLEHRAGELFYGPRQFSAVKLLQIARQAGRGGAQLQRRDGGRGAGAAPVAGGVRGPDARRGGRGMTVQAPVVGHGEPGLGTLFGFIATDPVLGAGEYIVAFEAGAANAAVNGGVGDGPSPAGEGAGGQSRLHHLRRQRPGASRWCTCCRATTSTRRPT